MIDTDPLAVTQMEHRVGRGVPGFPDSERMGGSLLRDAQDFRPSKSGLLLANTWLSPLYYNDEAVQILTYPELNKGSASLEGLLRDRIQSLMIDPPVASQSHSPREIVSGRRRYVCRTFLLAPSMASSRDATVAILIERKQQWVSGFSDVAAEFRLTKRETETIQLLVYGLTSKEIADRMQISPCTVKAFLRFAMAKMGVTTRAGLVGQILVRRLGACGAPVP